jgi:hypothetical protein
MDAALLTDTPSSTPAPSLIRPKARLPGEEDRLESPRISIANAADRPLPTREKPHRSGRKTVLLAGAGIVTVLIVGGAAYHERTRLAQMPMVQHLAATPMVHRLLTAVPAARPPGAPARIVSTDVVLPPPVHPQIAAPTTQPSVPEKTRDNAGPVHAPASTVPPATTRPAEAVVTSAPAQQAATASPAAPVSTQQAELREITSLHPDAPPAPPTVAPTPAVVASIEPPAKPASLSPAAPSGQAAAKPANTAPSMPAPLAPTQAETYAAPTPAVHMVVPRPTDPVEQAVALQAGPMTPPQQLDVLHLMTEMAVVVRDLRTENGQLRSQVADLSKKVDADMTQFDRRLSLAEAKGAIAAAMGAGRTQEAPATPIVAAPAAAAPQPTAATTPPAPPPLIRSVKDYRIQAASPGLAMLSMVGLSDGDSSTIQVAVGDDIPGIGRIQSIYQRGTGWVVQTDHGLIQ